MWTPKRLLCIGAHTDDYELGAGGTIARFIESDMEVIGLSLSFCRGKEPAGFRAGCLIGENYQSGEALGIDKANIIIENVPVENFDEHRQYILDRMIDLRDSFSPDVVLTHCSADIHQDHSVVYAETLRAFKHTTVLGYRMPWNMRHSREDSFVCLEERHLETKLAALGCYKSQQHRPYMHPDMIRAQAKLTGLLVNAQLAESFETINMVVR